MAELTTKQRISREILLSKEEILADYRLACESREVSLLGRKDVFMGRAKFGIFGDGKEIAQIAMAKVFRKGDFRSGYYRDQTFVAAVGGLTWKDFFGQLYADSDGENDPFSGGRSMNGHYSNRWIDENGQWLPQTDMYNQIMDVSSTAGQMPRAIGIGYASKLYRSNPALAQKTDFSHHGNEVCFATIGDASTSQGMFFESINAAGVLQVPVIFSVWDDGYGISVPISYQTTKASISAALAGFQKEENSNGLEIITVKGWDYPALVQAYRKAAISARDKHIPVLVHVQELTQPQGHSASGSHERYKSTERLQWEESLDCNVKFKEWILSNDIAEIHELTDIELQAKEVAKKARAAAWTSFRGGIDRENKEGLTLINQLAAELPEHKAIQDIAQKLKAQPTPLRRDVLSAAKRALYLTRLSKSSLENQLQAYCNYIQEANRVRYSTHLYSEGPSSPLHVQPIAPIFDEAAPLVEGREVINRYFDQLFEKDARVFALGEDVGKIGDVNQGFAGLQDKYGELRITDTGIRETTIIGQGIGAAMRGLRPIVEIQYFDYIFYALPTLTDDLACLRYRSVGQQAAPLIVRTRGHRLEGIWHSGSHMGVMIHALRGMHILVPRNFTQAAGLYNTILKGDDPALMIECLNGYRVKEKLPTNLDEICVPLGTPEILREGTDLTIVTYGSMCRIVLEAAEQLHSIFGISLEVIDVQTLLPFDLPQTVCQSIKKTNRVIFADEDMPGGASAYMMQQVVEEQGGYRWLDSAPKTISAQAHRPAYSSDGDYFSKPNVETVIDTAYALMHEAQPTRFPM
jgi:pyruvate/2-oxoglutarate/acetoin dehydrogenase E1 component/TPP-dependent pyruvate/acetoin dehydrogenase alpha subunit